MLGRKGAVSAERLALRDAFFQALGAYRRREWDEARTGFEGCLALAPGDGPSQAFLCRIDWFGAAPPGPDWDGVWPRRKSETEK